MVCVSVPAAADVALDAGTAAEAAGAAGAVGDAAATGAGLSSAVDAAGSGIGALGSGIGASSPLDAIMAGITAGATDTVPEAADSGAAGLLGIGQDAATNAAGGAGGFIDSADSAAPLVSGAITDGTGISPAATTAAQAGNALNSASGSSGIGGYLSKQNPLSLALAGSTGLSAIQALMPKKKVNTAQNAADVLATNPNFSNPNLPQYTMQNTATPYSGNWYTYGQQPEQAMYNAMPVQTHARGGRVHGYAAGGRTMPGLINNTGPLPAPPIMPVSSAPAAPINLSPSLPVPSMGPPPVLNMNNIAAAPHNTAMPTSSVQSINPLQFLSSSGSIMPSGSGLSFNQARGYAHGGRIGGYAMGGNVAPPMGMAPPQPNAMPQMPPAAPQQVPMGKAPNPLALNNAAFKIGHVIGQHMKKRGMTPDGRVQGKGGGQDDAIPAKLSKDEFVIPADVTSALGDGSSEAGSQKLHGLMDNVRKHKTGSTKYPPKAKNPLAYLPKGKK